MATIFPRHPIADYKAWRPHYDGDRPRRAAAGLTEMGVYQNTAKPNDVLVVWSAAAVAGFNEMVASKGLEANMKEAGVTGPPELWIAERPPIQRAGGCSGQQEYWPLPSSASTEWAPPCRAPIT